MPTANFRRPYRMVNRPPAQMRINAPSAFIYGLCDPRNGQLKYVGKSTRGWARLQEHIQACKVKRSTLKNNWIKSLLRQDLLPDAFVIEPGASPEQEEFWIAYFKSVGCALLNHTKGGEGTVGYNHTEATKARLSAMKAGKPGRAHSEAHKQYMSDILKGRRKPDEVRLALSKARGGRPVVDQHGNRYETYSDAARAIGTTVASVTRVLKRDRKQIKGYYLGYADADR